MNDEQRKKLMALAMRACSVGELGVLEDFVEGLGNERVISFARGALLANDVRAHVDNTLKTYMQLLVVAEADWHAARARERETDTHPCDHFDPVVCMCKGACSCHWNQPTGFG